MLQSASRYRAGPRDSAVQTIQIVPFRLGHLLRLLRIERAIFWAGRLAAPVVPGIPPRLRRAVRRR